MNQRVPRKSAGRNRRRKPPARFDWHRSKPLRLEGLEDRALLTAGVREEYLLELINQMRTDPVDELPLLLNSTDPNVQSALSFFNVDKTLLTQQWATLTAAPPLTYNDILASTALSHSELMSQDDQQSHQLPGESDPLTRIQAAGYPVSIVGENIFAYVQGMFDAHAAFAIDWGTGTGGMETPPGHRQNIMNAAFREVGLGVVDGGGAGKTTGPVLVTEDFGAQQNVGNPYLVGAVFTGNAYSLSGEGTAQVSSNGLANITVTAVSTANPATSFSATTTAAGGYQLQLPAGSYTVTFSGSALAANVVKSVTVGTDNVLLNVAGAAAVSNVAAFSVGNEPAAAGSTVTVPINLNDGDDNLSSSDPIQQIEAVVTYDSSKLSVNANSVSPGSLLTSGGQTWDVQANPNYNNSGNTILIVAADSNAANGGGLSGDFPSNGAASDVFDVTFTVNSGATGTANVDVEAGTADGKKSTYLTLEDKTSLTLAPALPVSGSVTVSQAPQITSGDSGTFSAGTAGTFTVATTGVPTAAITEIGSLPSGVTLTDNKDGTATLTSTSDAAAGAYQFTIDANNGVGAQVTQAFTLTILPAPIIASGTSLTGTLGTAIPAAAVATFTHGDGSDPASDFTASIDWGDGQTAAGTVSESGATYSVAGSHTYADSGTFAVATTIAEGGVSTVANGSAVIISGQTFNVTEHTYVIGSGTITVSAANGALSGDAGPGQLTVNGEGSNVSVGVFAFNPDGSFTYTPGANFPGYDSAQVSVKDGNGDMKTETVNVLSQPAAVVWKFYESVLNRTPDPGGLQYWTNYFNNGGQTGQMAVGFFESTELLDKIITNYYQQYLLRTPDASGIAYWVSQWQATGEPEGIKAGFADSPEFFNSAGGTPQSWLAALYQRILNRTPDPAGESYWLNYYQQQTAAGVAAGDVQQQIALGFFDSAEAYGDDVIGWFNEYLGRNPTSSEQTQYVNQMAGGATDRTIEQEITNTSEYANEPPTRADGTASPLPDYYQAAPQSQAAVAAKDALFASL